jgi:ornithine cyclodeaminase
MKIFTLPEIQAALDEDAAFAAVEQGFRRFYAREAQIAAVGHPGFPDAPGDDVSVIQIATSFYRNDLLGLPSSNGFMAVMSAKTGQVMALLHDQGQLTDQRTAMAGAIAGRAPPSSASSE